MCRMEMKAVLLSAGSGITPPWASGGQARGRRNVSPRGGEAQTVALRFGFGGSFPSGACVASCLKPGNLVL